MGDPKTGNEALTQDWQRMGCLQKSVWITPNPVIPPWKKFLAEADLTDWVLLFESAELGPVDDVEIARRVWKLDNLAARYARYLSEYRELPRRLRATRASSLGADPWGVARRGARAYVGILEDDPVLPVALLPRRHPALQADELHREVRAALRSCLFKENS